MANTGKGTIREVKDEDWPQIYNLIERVFLRKDEAGFMQELKSNGDVVYAAVIARHHDINGFIAFSRLKLNENGKIHDALVMAPFLVDPLWQGKGCGSDLIHTAHEVLTNRGEKLIFVLGEERYYSRFGYNKKTASPYKGPYASAFLLATSLANDIPETGTLTYPHAFAKMIG